MINLNSNGKVLNIYLHSLCESRPLSLSVCASFRNVNTIAFIEGKFSVYLLKIYKSF